MLADGCGIKNRGFYMNNFLRQIESTRSRRMENAFLKCIEPCDITERVVDSIIHAIAGNDQVWTRQLEQPFETLVKRRAGNETSGMPRL
jgi:hypothetical protein